MYEIQSRFNKVTRKMYYGLVGKTEIFGFATVTKAREFLQKLKNMV